MAPTQGRTNGFAKCFLAGACSAPAPLRLALPKPGNRRREGLPHPFALRARGEHGGRGSAGGVMQIGIAVPDTGTVDIATLAFRAEALGFGSLWVPEHTVFPVRDEERSLPPGPRQA